MAENATKRPAKTGTAKTEVIIGTAAGKMLAATRALTDAFAQSEKIVTLLEENSLKIADSEDKLAGLKTEYERTKAEQDFQLNLEYKTNEAEFANRYLQANGKVAVDHDTFNELKEDHDKLKRDFKSQLATETAIVKSQLEKDYASQKALDAANNGLKEAENVARIKSLETQLTAANNMVDVWKGQLEAERNAGIKRAEASQIGTLNVGAGAR